MADYPGRFMVAAGLLLRAIHTVGREQRFIRGEEIQAAGTLHPEGPILVIKNGFVSTVAISANGQYTLLSIHGPGGLVGEHALLGGTSEAHGLAVMGMSDGSAWLVRQDRFRRDPAGPPKGMGGASSPPARSGRGCRRADLPDGRRDL